MFMNLDICGFDIVLFDLDGTIYFGETIIDGANEVIRFFRNNGKKILFTTNNSTKSRRQVYEKLIKIGVECAFDEILTSGYMAALYAKVHQFKNVYIFGSDSLKQEFSEQDVQLCSHEGAENMVIGYNPNMTYNELTTAVRVAMNAKNLIACNKERTFLGNEAKVMPGCGAMTASIEWCANRICDITVGKPSTFMVDYIIERYGYEAKRIMIIGDTYESDVVMAKKLGAQAVLIGNTLDADVVSVKSIANILDCFLNSDV